MKTQQAVTAELEKQYLHRLQLRLERYLRCACRNCKNRVPVKIDMGDLGWVERYGCAKGLQMQRGSNTCPSFDCLYDRKQVEKSLLDDIRDPAVCGAKEPKIAALMWVLHEDEDAGKGGFWGRLKSVFTGENR